MLISLLLDQNGNLVAAGRASDQIPLGNRYWWHRLGLSDRFSNEFETVVVELNDRQLVRTILNYHLAPSEHRLNTIMDRLEGPLQTRRRFIVGQFAA
jgi:hypothetical protein